MREVELGSVCKFINGDRGKNYPAQDAFVKEGIPFINAGSLNNKRIDISKVNFITEEKYNSLSSGKVEISDILFCLRGSLGKYSINTELTQGAIASSLVLLRVMPELDVNYLANYLGSQGIRSQIYVNDNGSSQPNLSASNVKKFKIPLPPLPTQQKIAAILDEADKLRQLNKQLIAKYDELTQSLFLDMFGDYLNGDLIPLKEVVKFSQGQQFGVELQSLEPKNGYSRFLRIVDFTQGDDLRYVPNEDGKYYVNLDDIVIVRYGASAGFVGTNKEGVLANNLFKVNYDRNIFNQQYLFFTFQHRKFKGFVEKEAFGAAMPALSFKVMERFEIALPPINLQNQFAERVQAIEAQKVQAQQSLAKAEDLFNSLLQRAFKGELV